MRRVACISMNDSPAFAFAALPAVFSWRNLGWDTRVNICGGSPAARPVELLADGLRQAGADVVVSLPEQHGVKTNGYGWCRLARYFDAANLATDDTFTVTSDADMMRVAQLDVPLEARDRLVCWGHNLYDGTELAGRQPTCYVGGFRLGWRHLQIRQEDLDAAATVKGWDDETVVQVVWRRQPPSRFLIDRPNRTRAEVRRVDREDWQGVNMTGQIDAHFRRGGWKDAEWEIMRPGVAQVLTAEQMKTVEQWRKLWVSFYGN